MNEAIEVLDHGYIRLVETYGKGDAGVPEAGIIEAARQSTQGNFRGWAPYQLCEKCPTPALRLRAHDRSCAAWEAL